MKTKSLAVIVSGAAVVALCLFGACFPQTSRGQTESAPPPPPDGSTAPAAPDTTPALPPGVYPSSPLAQVIKLTQSGVSEDVLMAYVTNSVSTFNLDPDKIIYMKDIGAPDEIVTAMIQRDQVLQQAMAAPASQPPPQPAPSTDTTVADTTDVAPPPTDVTVDYFYGTLAPYGTWVDVDGYGRCWRPTAVFYNSSWQPYCDHGHWVYTDCGWYWISDYSWGWAPFHYGRWFRDTHFGWCWTPDTVWGPSWVTWRYSNDYCGWAPLPPRAVYRAGVGIVYNGAAVSFGFDFGLSVGAFTFVPTRNFCDPHPRRYRVEAHEATQIFSHTTIINNINVDSHNRTIINNGIAPEHITAVTRTEIHPVTIRDTTGPVVRGEQLGRDGRTLIVNRPHFNDNPPHNQPVVQPVMGSPYQSPNNHGNDNGQPQHRYQSPAPTSPAGQPQAPHTGTFGSPGHNGTTAPVSHPSSPINHYVPPTPIQIPANNNLNNSTDNRRYSSPRQQQYPGTSTGNNVNRRSEPVTIPPSQPHYGAPYNGQPSQPTQPSPGHPNNPPPSPAEPQHTYIPPRNEPAPNQSRANYSSPPASGNQSHGSSAPASSGQSQRSGGNKNQTGQQ